MSKADEMFEKLGINDFNSDYFHEKINELVQAVKQLDKNIKEKQ